MNLKSMLRASIAVATIGCFGFAPSIANAGQWSHRQDQKNQWKDLAIGSGILGAIGVLSHNDTLTGIGAAGAIYSAYRYEEEQDGHGWYHIERGRRIYDRDYRPERGRDWNRGRDWDRDRDWNNGRDQNRGRDQDWNHGRDRDRNSRSDNGRDGRDRGRDSGRDSRDGGNRHGRG